MAGGGRAQRWASTPAATRLVCREFEDGSVCFDPETGETLLLSHLSRFLLDLWEDRPTRAQTRDDLLAQVLAVDDSATQAPNAGDQVDEALSELQRAGLVAHSACA